MENKILKYGLIDSDDIVVVETYNLDDFLSTVKEELNIKATSIEELMNLLPKGYRLPIGYCSRTLCMVYPSQIEDYVGYSPELDEDLFSFEILSLDDVEVSQC